MTTREPLLRAFIVVLLCVFALAAAREVPRAMAPDDDPGCTLLVRWVMGQKVFQCNTVNCDCSGGEMEACRYEEYQDEGGDYITCSCCGTLPWGNGCLPKFYFPEGNGWLCQDVTCVGECAPEAGGGGAWSVYCPCVW